MHPAPSLKNIGQLYIPFRFRNIAAEAVSLKHFTGTDLHKLDRIFTHLRRGGIAVLSGEWSQIEKAAHYVHRKKKELARSSSSLKLHKSGRLRKKNPRSQNETDITLSRLMCYADASGLLQINPPPDLPFLLELLGENPGANNECPFLLPITTVQNLRVSLSRTYPVPALETALIASENVLPPRSLETIDCFQKGLQDVKTLLPNKADILEIGCGSGCLTLLAAQELVDLQVHIYASDLLPEAIATPRVNIQRSSEAPSPECAPIQLIPAGDLFDIDLPLPSFDLIIFNPPWVLARVRGRTEIAIHDEGQKVLSRFLHKAPEHLKENGRILLGYADASGSKAVSNLEEIATRVGFVVENRFTQRVATHRTKRKWEHIMVYELTRG